MREGLLNQGKTKYLEAVCASDPIIELARTTYDLLQWPLIMGDGSANALLQLPAEPIGVPLFDALLKSGKVDTETYAKFQYMLQTVYYNQQGGIQTIKGTPEYPLQVVITIRARRAVALQMIMHVPKEELDDEEEQILDLLYQLLAAEYRKVRRTKDFSLKRMGHKLRKLLESSRDKEREAQYAADLEKEFGGDYLLVVSLLENDVRQESFLPFYLERINRLMENTLCIEFEGNIVILCGSLPRHSKLPKSVNDILEFNKTCTIHIGVTERFINLTEVRKYYHRALLTARMGERLNPEKYIFTFEQYEPLQVFLPAVSDYCEEAFLHPAIQNIIKWDEKYNTEYLQTIRAYLVSNRSNRESVRLLRIHQNTLIYRLTKMRELFGIDFSDGKQVLSLLCNVLFLEVARPDLLPLFEIEKKEE